VRTFLSQRTPSGVVNETFVAVVNDALRGFHRVAIPAEDLLLALASDDTPCSPEEFRRRFTQFVTGRLAGHDAQRVRVSLAAGTCQPQKYREQSGS
jgi:hypothetical protein